MKKIFAILAVVMFAVAANAEVLFEETFVTRRQSTYIVKTDKGYWPYASQWFTGYAGQNSETVEGNQYDNDYTNVASYTVSIRGKKLNGSDKNTVGLFFGANKAAEENYVKFVGALPEVEEGDLLKFQICSSEAAGGTLAEMAVKVNETVLTLPEITLGAQCVTSEVSVALPAGQIDSLKFSFNNVETQKFISNIKIESAGAEEGIENVVLTEKAQKVMIDGAMYIIRDEKLFDVRGAQVR